MSKIAFITGAASGIGLATAQLFHQKGWTLGLADLSLNSLNEATQHLGTERVFRYQMDVTEEAQVKETLDALTSQTGGKLHLLFNCAGILQVDRFEDISHTQHQRILDVNVMGVINCCQAALPYLKQTQDAQVINMSSASATFGVPDFAVYAASKAAVSSLTEALAIEWAPYDIAVGDIMPPFVGTHMLNSQQSRPPIIERMGVDLVAKDVAKAVWQQLQHRSLHRPVGMAFSLTYHMSEFTPRWLQSAVMSWLSRPKS